MRRAIARESEKAKGQVRFHIIVSAAIIAAVRLARDDIRMPGRRLVAVVADSVALATKILKKVVER